jgi:hypothetical protein
MKARSRNIRNQISSLQTEDGVAAVLSIILFL